VAGDSDRGVAGVLALGARHADIGQTGAEPWTVLADPEDNVFCVRDTPLATL
jgi:glyoxalase superfamily protein